MFLANRVADKTANRRWILDRFAEQGVETGRVQLAGSAPHFEYLQYYDRLDVALDAAPYNGGTTTMEAIWQGVPVLTYDGGRWSSRTSQTLLRRTHLAEFAYDTRQEMIASAIAMGNDPLTPKRLTQLRHTMRDRLVNLPVCDGAQLARGMEALIESIAVFD